MLQSRSPPWSCIPFDRRYAVDLTYVIQNHARRDIEQCCDLLEVCVLGFTQNLFVLLSEMYSCLHIHSRWHEDSPAHPIDVQHVVPFRTTQFLSNIRRVLSRNWLTLNIWKGDGSTFFHENSVLCFHSHLSHLSQRVSPCRNDLNYNFAFRVSPCTQIDTKLIIGFDLDTTRSSFPVFSFLDVLIDLKWLQGKQ